MASRLETATTSQFRKDLKKAIRQGKNIKLLKQIMEQLASQKKLATRHKDHSLHNNWKGSRDCHITPDWVMIYRVDDGVIYFERLGSHSDLFG